MAAYDLKLILDRGRTPSCLPVRTNGYASFPLTSQRRNHFPSMATKGTRVQTKLRIKMGHLEFEYEGDATYDNEMVKDLFSHIQSLVGTAPSATFDVLPPPTDPDNEGRVADISSDLNNLSVQTVAARLDAKSARDVALAAAAQIQVCQGRSSFTRKELLNAMQQANGYYNQSMSGNLSTTINRLVSARTLMTMTGDQMSLSASELTRLKAALAQS